MSVVIAALLAVLKYNYDIFCLAGTMYITYKVKPEVSIGTEKEWSSFKTGDLI
jgi:hypothetical protein